MGCGACPCAMIHDLAAGGRRSKYLLFSIDAFGSSRVRSRSKAIDLATVIMLAQVSSHALLEHLGLICHPLFRGCVIVLLLAVTALVLSKRCHPSFHV